MTNRRSWAEPAPRSDRLGESRTSPEIATRLAALDWGRIERDLWARGYAETDPVLTPEECAELVGLYADDHHFRHRVEMARHRFGEGWCS